jgi:hypothetical protein
MEGFVMRVLIAAILAIWMAQQVDAGFVADPTCDAPDLLPDDIDHYKNRLSIFLVANCPVAAQGGLDCEGQIQNLTFEFLTCNLAFPDKAKRMACFDYVSRKADWWKLDTQ